MSTKSWTPAPAGYPENGELFARAVVGGGADCSVPPLAPAGDSGLPVAGFGVPMRTAARFGTHITTIVPRFNGTPLGLPSSRRPSS